MAERIKASAGTGQVSAGSEIAFSLSPSLFKYGSPYLSVYGLAGAETVDLWKKVGDSWEEVVDSSGNQIQFTTN